MKTKFQRLQLAAFAVLCLAWCGVARANTLTNNLLVHLTFDGNFNDDSGNGNNGAAVASGSAPDAGPAFIPGIIGSNAVSVTTMKDGSIIDYVTLGYPTQLYFDNTGSFSISFWTSYTNSADDPPFISNKNWSSSGNQGWGIFTQGGGNFRVNVTDDGGQKESTTTTPIIRDGKWHNVAVTFDRNSLVNIYVDGTNYSHDTLSEVVGNIDTYMSGWSVNIGQDGTGGYTDGGSAQMINVGIDDLGIWGRVLTPLEVGAIYTSGLAGSNLVQAVTKLIPSVSSASPAPGVNNAPGNPVLSISIANGDTALATNTVKLSLDGVQVAPSLSVSNGITILAYATTNLLASGSTHTVGLTFSDNNATPDVTTTNWSFTVATYPVIPASFALPAASVNTNLPGFQMRLSQISDQAIVANDGAGRGVLPECVSFAEAQLAGLLIDPMTGLPQAETVTPGPLTNGAYAVTNVINFTFTGNDQGNFTSANGYPKSTLPGLNVTDQDNLAVEFAGYLKLAAGYYTFGANSADGFRMTIGANARDAFATQVGLLDIRTVPANTTFSFGVSQSGYYPFRVVWYRTASLPDNSGTAGLELFSVSPSGQKTLVNDPTTNSAVLSFQSLSSTASFAPYVQYAGPTAFLNPYTGQDLGFPSVQVQIHDGSAASVGTNSIQLTVDGAAVPATLAKSNGVTTVTYTPGGLQLPRTVHTGQISYAAAGTNYAGAWQFNGLRNYVLPAPLFYETFEELADGVLPTNWVQLNYTTPETTNSSSFSNPNSQAFLGWNVINVSDVTWGDGPQHFYVGLYQQLNGAFFDSVTNPLMVNEFLYAESDNRGGNQVQWITSPSYNLSGKTGIVLAFNSSYEQNQDNIDGIEYTLNNGANWLPLVYLMMGDNDTQNPSQIFRFPGGTVDALSTLNTPNGGVAVWKDPVTGKAMGGTYGAPLGAPVTQALAPYIEGRINDDPYESMRFEVFRVAGADNQSNVRFRFLQDGTGSWFWGIDNLGIYSVPSLVNVSSGPGLITAAESGGKVVLSWTAGTNVQLQQNPVLGTTNWVNVAGTLGAGGYTNTVGSVSTNLFYRLIQQ